MTTKIFYNGRSQAVRIPKEYRFEVDEVVVRRLGDGIYVEPLKSDAWPQGWFEDILITDDTFTRPDQGDLPPPPLLDAGRE